MRYLSLFTGIGGFELGIKQAYENIKSREQESIRQRTERNDIQLGRDSSNTSISGEESKQKQRCGLGEWLCIGYSEIDKYAIQIYQKHFPENKNYGDITKIDERGLPDFELLCGGFPCQSFSIAGKRGGFEDTRGTLFFDIARIIKHKRPNRFLLENVKGLLSHDDGRTFNTIIATLDELGYDVQWQVLNSKNFGVPQNRERVFIVGHLRGTPRPKVFPFGESNTEDNAESKLHNRRELLEGNGSESLLEEKSETNSYAVRRLTPTECERLQGFPDGWTNGVSDTQRYKTLGNAVTVNVIEAIMKKLYGA